LSPVRSYLTTGGRGRESRAASVPICRQRDYAWL
jgi:hypothetical protein